MGTPAPDDSKRSFQAREQLSNSHSGNVHVSALQAYSLDNRRTPEAPDCANVTMTAGRPECAVDCNQATIDTDTPQLREIVQHPSSKAPSLFEDNCSYVPFELIPPCQETSQVVAKVDVASSISHVSILKQEGQSQCSTCLEPLQATQNLSQPRLDQPMPETDLMSIKRSSTHTCDTLSVESSKVDALSGEFELTVPSASCKVPPRDSVSEDCLVQCRATRVAPRCWRVHCGAADGAFLIICEFQQPWRAPSGHGRSAFCKVLLRHMYCWQWSHVFRR